MRIPEFKDGVFSEPEGMTLEYKSCGSKLPRSFWETYSSFANTSGGTVILGVSEQDGVPLATGVTDPQKILDDMWSMLNDERKVSANLLTEGNVRVFDVGDATLVAIHVPRADRLRRPVYIDDNVQRGTYRRNGQGDYHCDPEAIYAMIRDSSPTPSDNTVVDAALDELDFETIARYRNVLRAANPGHPWLSLPDDGLLRMIGAAAMDGDVLRPTLAGLVMFGKDHNIIRHLPGYFLDFLEYGTGPEWAGRRNSGMGTWSGNVYDFFEHVSQRIALNTRNPFELDGMRRIDDNDLMKAQREMLVNGLVNADYRLGGGVRVEMHPDVFFVRNPGVFRIPLEKAVRGGISDPRNPHLMRMFMLVGAVEHTGSGLYCIFDTCRRYGLGEPVFYEDYEPSLVTAMMPLSESGRVGGEEIIDIIAGDDSVTFDEIASRLNVSKSTVSRQISSLKRAGVLERIGGTHGGRWRIVRHQNSCVSRLGLRGA